ncbi:MAG: DUF885 family protein, partial [Gemmataceae bacterium]
MSAPATTAVLDRPAPVVSEVVRGRLADFADLAKPKIAVMALVTVAVGYLLGAAPSVNWQLLIHTLIGAGVVAAGGSALNCWLERRADARMHRTRNRPLVAGRMHHLEALVFGLTLAVRRWTGSDLDATGLQEVYAWGWSEHRRILAEQRIEAEKVLPGATPMEAMRWLGTNGPAVEGVPEIRARLQQMMDVAIAELDGTHFDLAAPVRRVEAMI